MDSKNILKSKSVWSNLVMAALAFVPGVQNFIIENPEIYASLWAGINVILRLISKGKVELK